jgi:hypothetical protein
MKKLFIALLLLLPGIAHAAESWPAGTATTIAAASELGATYEASGAYWDASEEQLYTVADNGKLSILTGAATANVNGTPAVEAEEFTADLGSYDLEGVTKITDGSDIVYIGIERDFGDSNKDKLIAYDTSLEEEVAAWDLSPLLDGTDLDGDAMDVNLGLEALTFIPNGEHPYADQSAGGVFVAGRQQDGALIYMSVDVTTSGAAVTELDTIASHYPSDIAGLHYDSQTQKMYAVYDANNRMVIMDANGGNSTSYVMASGTHDEEGITMAPTCSGDTGSIYITGDANGGNPPDVYRFDDFSLNCVEEEPEEVPDDDPDSENNGGEEENEIDGDDDESAPSEIIGSTTVAGNTVTIAMDDGTTVTSQPFSGTADVEVAALRGGKRVIVSNGKRVAVYRGTELVGRKKMRNKRLRHFTIGVRRFPNRNGQTIILAGRRKKKESVSIARLTRGDRIKKVYRKRVQKKKNVRRFRIRKKRGAKFHIYFGNTKTRWKVGRRGKLKRLR